MVVLPTVCIFDLPISVASQTITLKLITMNRLQWFSAISFLFLLSCKKDAGNGGGNSNTPTTPVVTTATAGTITATSLQIGGTVTADGGAPVTARGVCWNVVTATIADPKTVDGAGLGSFTSSVTNLRPFTAYYVRAYATNSAGTGYGQDVIIVTPKEITLPTVVTNPPGPVTDVSGSVSGEVMSDGNATVTGRGICWGTSQNPTISGNKIALGTGVGGFFTNILGLPVNVTYYVRAYATNSLGTSYGDQVSFTTAYVIGNLYQGGKIFYVDNTKLHGLITAVSDQSGGARWNNTSNPYKDINAYSVSNGVANTNAINAAIGGSASAAAVCKAYNGGGYTDWYLPSRDELYLLYVKKPIIGGFQNYFYWSSTASGSHVANAWAEDFGSGSQYSNKDKTDPLLVRAIRKF